MGESYDSVFGPLASTYEECRAETVAVYLSLLPEVLNVWNIPEKDHADVTYCVWLAMAVSGLKSLPYYIMEQEVLKIDFLKLCCGVWTESVSLNNCCRNGARHTLRDASPSYALWRKRA